MNSTQNITEISVIIDSRIYGYLFAPIVTAFANRGVHLYIYTPRRIQDAVHKDIGANNQIEFLDLDPIRKRHRWRWIIHRVAMDLFVRDDFSYQMFKKKYEITKTLPPLRRFLTKIGSLLPKVSNKSINCFLERIAGIGLENPFCTKVIMVGSLNASSELLCSKHQKIITVMESWDHAVKQPNGYTSDLVFAWNEDLKHDWYRFQSDMNVHVFYPLKLRYARDAVKGSELLCENKKIRPFFVYAVAGTRRFCIDTLIRVEQKLIRDLARVAENLGWDLFIKPRPNGEDGEFADIENDFSNVRVGSISEIGIDQPADYFLSDEYNSRRFSEIAGAEFVINAFTTFGLDAAAAGIPVLQIDIQNATGYAESKLIYGNYHLEKHLLGRKFVLRVEGDFISSFIKSLQLSKTLSKKYTAELNEWLFSDKSESQSIEVLIQKTIEAVKEGS